MITYSQVQSIRTSLHTASNAAQRVTIAVDQILPLLPPDAAERLTLAMRGANKLLDEAKACAAAAFAGDTAETLLPCVVGDEAIAKALGEVP